MAHIGNVLSLFDGMSCGQIALNRAGIKYANYFASEIDKNAVKVTLDNFPNTIQLGDVTEIDFKSIGKIDLLVGGSPCQGFSFSGKQLNFNDPRSALFFEFVRALKEIKPKYFMLENVRMKKEYQDVISDHLGTPPVIINSSFFSAQKRNRLYWTNIPINIFEDKNIYLKQILEIEPKNPTYLSDSTKKRLEGYGVPLLTGEESKARCLTAMDYVKIGKQGNYLLDSSKIKARKLTVLECKRLQNVPDDYIMNVSNTQAYKMLGNGWTVDVIAHIFKGIKQ
jgi:site-specific DNA-cytosine methylase